jgi:Gamma-glutamyl cyclotransferase, AIG2-like
MPRGYLKVFQYGSNMNAERLNSGKRLNDKARVVGVARLDGHGVRFDLYSTTNRCGVTDIVAAGDEHVLGVLYDIPIRLVIAPPGRRSKMDTIEGAQPDGTGNYKRVRLRVVMDGQDIDAVTYVGTGAGRRRFARRTSEEQRVSDNYFGHLVRGAQTFEFPARIPTVS